MAILRDPAGGREYPLSGARHLLGRGPDCDIRFDDPLVSSRHALITRTGDNFFLEDLKSRNGTALNGQRVFGSIPLHPGDRVELGGHPLFFLDANAVPFSVTEAPSGVEPAVVQSLELSDGLRTEVSPAAKLRAVLEISRNLSNSLKIEEVLPKILESLFALFPQTDRGFILLWDMDTKRLFPKAVRHRHVPSEEAAISRTVLDYAIRTARAVLSADAGHDDRFDASQSIRLHQIRSIMCVPLLDQRSECLGVIQLDTQASGRTYHQEDLDVLAVAGLQAARAVETAKRYQELRELESATQIQRSFLPAERPKAAGFQFFDYYASAGQVGGDYYDYVRLADDKLGVALGDVAGKGVTAALLMARLSASARFCLATAPTVATAVRQVNTTVTRACGDDRFITMVVGVIDLNAFTMTLVNAGHMPPLRRRKDGRVDEIAAAQAGIPLGVFDRPYEETEVPLERGDLLVLYTDGVTEARNPQGELYGLDRMLTLLRQSPGDATGFGQALLADVRRFAAGRPPADDLTLVCVSRDE
jgi:phosphoserine phosphatase RsbU/P